jgi:O-antigen/teichoic acid export membrane protein
MSEARRGLARITANYGRLGATMLFGLALVPLQILWVGTEGFGLLVAIGASVGLAAMFQDVMRNSMVRELGVVWHAAKDREDDESNHHFQRVYASSFILCAFVTLLTAMVFLVLYILIEKSIPPFQTLDPEYRRAGSWILLAEGASTCLLVLLSPAYNMYVVTERFFESNLWFTLKRCTYLASTIVLFFVLGSDDVELSLKLYGICAASLAILILLFAVTRIMVIDPMLRPRLGMADRAALKEILGTFRWNSAVVTAMNLHERIGAWIMLSMFGTWGAAIFGLALRLVSYVRMATLGISFGLDAVTARLSADEENTSMTVVVKHSTRLLAYVAFPAAITVLLLAQPLLQLWIGLATKNPGSSSGLAVIAPASLLIQIMVLGTMSRAIADGWMKMMYGAGHIKKYAPLILAGGLANPIIAFILIYLIGRGSDEHYLATFGWLGPAIGFGASLFLVHLLILPLIAGPCFGTTWGGLMKMLVRPLTLALLPAPIYLTVLLWDGPAPWEIVLGSCAAYAILYGVLGIAFGLEAPEQKRILQRLRALVS